MPYSSQPYIFGGKQAESLAAKANRTLKQSPHQSRAEHTQVEVLAETPCYGFTVPRYFLLVLRRAAA